MENAIYFFRYKSIRRSCEGVGAGLFLVMAAMILAATLTVSSCDNKIEEYEGEYEETYVSNEIRDEISSYLRDSYLQWSQQASPSDIEAVNKRYSILYRNFFSRSWYPYLMDKFMNNKELVLQLSMD